MASLAPRPNPWWLLRLRLTAAGILATARNDLGERLSARKGHQEHWSIDLDGRVETLVVPRGLLERLRADGRLLAAGARRLPLFVAPPPALRALPWVAALRRVFEHEGLSDVEPVRLSLLGWRRRGEFAFPLSGLTIERAEPGDMPYVDLGLPGLARWERVSSDLVDDALRELRPDIVVAPPEALGRLRDIDPRLIVVLDRGRTDPSWRAIQVARPGSAVVWAPLVADGSGSSFVSKLVSELVADEHVHDAHQFAAAEAASELGTTPWLVANPESNLGLGLGDVAASLRGRAEALQGIDPGARWQAMAKHAVSPLLRDVLLDVAPTADLVVDTAREAVEAATRRPESLADAGDILRDLADRGHRLTAAESTVDKIQSALSRVHADPECVQEVRGRQQRVVDVTMRRDGDSESEWIGAKTPLIAEATYLLLVQIGHPSTHSLVVGAPTPLDPLLPPPLKDDGHEIELVVFGHDFDVVGAARRSVLLPLVGTSERAEFEVVAPRAAEGASLNARMRIGVFHRCNLVQSLLLTAQVADSDGAASDDGGGVVVEVETSRTHRFADDIAELRPRALSLGLNASNGTHTVWLKGPDAVDDVTLPEAMLDDQINAFREIMAAASANGKVPRFPALPEPESPPSPQVHGYLRKLAYRGQVIHDALFGKLESIGKDLSDLLDAPDSTVQITWHEPGYAFPWSIVYDFELPDEAAQPKPFCLGYPPDDPPAPGDPPMKRCDHGAEKGGFCVYGFWGVRHRLENLLPSHGTPVESIERRKEAGVHVSTRFTGGQTADLVGRLTTKLPGAVTTPTAGQDLAALMWSDPDRPSVVVALGHLLLKFTEPRIELAHDGYLNANLVTRGLKKHLSAWTQPNSLVLLMACESAAVSVATISGLVDALTQCGAAGVVGTECDVFSDLVGRFAGELTLRMWSDGQSLGEAIVALRRELLLEGNPLGFAFTPFGPSELHLAA